MQEVKEVDIDSMLLSITTPRNLSALRNNIQKFLTLLLTLPPSSRFKIGGVSVDCIDEGFVALQIDDEHASLDELVENWREIAKDFSIAEGVAP